MNKVCEEAVSGFVGHNFLDIFRTVSNIRLISSDLVEIDSEMLGLTLNDGKWSQKTVLNFLSMILV